MATSNTGFQRATNIAVRKTVHGVTLRTDNYSLLSAFGAFSSISTSDIATMSSVDYQARLSAKISEINALGIYETLVINDTGAIVQNTNACPTTP